MMKKPGYDGRYPSSAGLKVGIRPISDLNRSIKIPHTIELDG
jgi:hypothetical protein